MSRFSVKVLAQPTSKLLSASLPTSRLGCPRKAIANERADEAIPEGLRFHDLRHTCAAILISNGQHMEEVKDHLGHSSIRVTSDSYGRLFPKARAASAESLDATFRGALSEETDEVRTKLPDSPIWVSGGQPERRPDLQLHLERTTGFEPATLTLAR